MSPSVDRAVSRGGYRALVRRIRGTVDAHLPPDARVLTVGKGDRELAQLGTRTTGHFPQDETGEYAGHYPADTSVVIAHLEALITTGYDHIVFPRTAYWWFDHYAGLEEHLNRRGSRLRHPGDHCRVWSLRGDGRPVAPSRRAQAIPVGAAETTAPAVPSDPHLNARLGRLLDALLVPGVPVGHLRRPAEPELRLLNHPVVSIDLAGGDELDPGPAIEECERQGAAVILVLSADDRLPGTHAQFGGAGNPMRRALEQGLPRIAHRAHLCSLYALKRAGSAPADHPPVEV